MKNSFIRHMVAVVISFVLIITEFVFLLTVGSDFYNFIYNYDVLKSIVLLFYGGFPLITIAITNRIFEGIGRYKYKLKNNIALVSMVVAFTIIYNVITWNNDFECNGFSLLIFCIWFLLCCLGMSLYYWVKSRN